MTGLRRYSPGHILGAAKRLHDKLDAGILHPRDFTVAANDFRFRDDSGDLWFLDAHTNRWYRFVEGRWQPSGTEPTSLEGPASLIIDVTLPAEEPEATFEAAFEGQGVETWTPTKALEVMVETTKSAYERGRISSDDAQDLLAREYVIDQQGTFWTVGVRSGHWYRFEKGEWTRSEEPPGLDSLLSLEVGPQECPACGQLVREGDLCPQCGEALVPHLPSVPAQAFFAALDFILSGADLIPEPVTDPWDSPPGFPEALTPSDIQCASCGATNPAGSRFCNQCGTALGCPSCGAANPADARFCGQCGADLGR